MKQHYQKNSDALFKEFKSSLKGLKTTDIEERQQKYGLNALKEKKPKNFLQVFLEQFCDLLVIILIIAAIISLTTGSVESTIVIFVVLIVNATLGTIQHFKAEKSLKSLKELSSPTAMILRDGKKQKIQASQIVPGDILFLEAGDIVPADGRVIENYSLQVNESALTGESEGVNKTSDLISKDEVALGDRLNMVFSSSLVTYGRATVLVTETGMDTELGKIATLINDTAERKTPLQVALDNFSKKLSLLILIICAIIFGLSIYRQMGIIDSLMFAVALAVAAIPEALSSIVTIALAIGTSKMAKENAIIKNLKAVEGLGCVSIICSDKTGTLTQNKMTVEGMYCTDETTRNRLTEISVLCNDTVITDKKTIGDPTETALVDYYSKNGGDYAQIKNKYQRLSEIPFDSDRKLMSTVHQINGEYIMFTKGALDVIINRLECILENGIQRKITRRDIEIINEQNTQMSKNGLRVLAFVQKTLKSTEISTADEKDFTFVGLISMMDPPRPESARAVANCHLAGIKPIMITGDHKITASAIAKKIGILQEGDMSVDGPELDKMSDDELVKILPKVSVYARVSPEHKIRIVKLWQSKGHIVAMTGDGVNDAPALKKADIGIAMGITGTAVSKDAASMILTDDNFATIIKSVANGRNIYRNIKNSIKFLLSGNMSGILAVVFTSLMGLPVPFTAVHLLFINLLTDSLPALAISTEPSDKDLLKEKPRKSGESILTKDFMIDIIYQGILIAVVTMFSFYKGLQIDAGTASTMAFSTLCFARLWHGFNCRGKKSVFKLGLFKNIFSIFAFLAGTLFLALALFVPVLQPWFDITPLSMSNILFVALMAFIPTFLIQFFRFAKE